MDLETLQKELEKIMQYDKPFEEKLEQLLNLYTSIDTVDSTDEF